MEAQALPLDLEQLKSLTGEDPEFMIEILEMIEEQSPEVVEEIDILMARKEFEPLGRAAHKYKSSVNILGNETLTRLLKDIELTAMDPGSREALPTMLDQFHEITDQLLVAIKRELAQLRAV
ncbi:MAG: Hpt domain-containing protein [Bacteroidetes bacterium]|nr:MAG: Hpt domain-containing protein [Bacteroidota bacterium]